MTAFEAGFIKYAQEYGLPDSQAVYILKRAADHPDVQDLLKEAYSSEDSGEELDTLQNMLELDNLDKQMQSYNNNPIT